MQNKKIIFLIPTLNIGGGERVASEVSLNLPNYIKITFVLFKNEIFYPYKGNLICLNLPISINFLLRIYYFFIGIFRFKKIVKKEKPDYIISFSKQADIINVLSNKKSDKKAILRVDNFMSEVCKGFEGRIYKIFIRFLFNKSFQIISVSQAAVDDLVKNFGIKKEKFKVIYNPLNVKKIQQIMIEPLEDKYKEIFENPVVINIGRLARQKSQKRLIKAFKDVKNEIKNVKLVILGQGCLEQELRQLIKDLNLEKDVYLLTWQENPFKFLAKSKVFVLSSLYEGFGNVIVEAMACSLPIISMDCKAGPREILAPDTDINDQAEDIEYAEYGILTPPLNEQKLSQAMIEILTNKELSDSLIEKSKQRANDFDTKKIIKDWDFLGY